MCVCVCKKKGGGDHFVKFRFVNLPLGDFNGCRFLGVFLFFFFFGGVGGGGVGVISYSSDIEKKNL